MANSKVHLQRPTGSTPLAETHSDSHSKSHSHGHHPSSQAELKPLALSFALISSFMLVEILTGLWIGSMALLSDGIHMVFDAFALGMALVASQWSLKKPTIQKSFGFRRFGVLAAFSNGWFLLFLSGLIVWSSSVRLLHPQIINPVAMLSVASLGLLINLFVLGLLHGKNSLNMRAAFLHVLADSLSSLGAIAAALIIRYTGWMQIDALLGLIFSLLIAWAAIGLLRNSGHILLEGSPAHLKPDEIRASMENFDQVESIHDFHTWTMDGSDLYVTAHLVLKTGPDSEDRVLNQINHSLQHLHQATHITLQIDRNPDPACVNNCQAP